MTPSNSSSSAALPAPRAARRDAALRVGAGPRPRSCAGCREEAPRAQLLRLVLGPEGALLPDLAGGGFGRGVWVHPSPRCLALAAPRGAAKSLRAEVVTRPEQLTEAIRSAASRRVAGLLASARRSRSLAVGSSAVAEALAQERVAVLVVGTDARAAAEAPTIERAVAAGLALSWGSVESLGHLCGRPAVAVLAVTDEKIAAALRGAVGLANLQGYEARAAVVEPHAGTALREVASLEDG